MGVKLLLVSLSVLLVIEGALGCLCLRNREDCNCLPRARLRLNRPRKFVAVFQPLPQDQLINPNVCRCGRPLLPAYNPVLTNDEEVVQDEMPSFGSRCICTNQQQLDDCDQFAADHRFVPSPLTPEVLPPPDLPPGTPFWTVNARGALELVQARAAYQNLAPYLQAPAELVEDKVEKDENFLQYFGGLLQSNAERVLNPLLNL